MSQYQFNIDTVLAATLRCIPKEVVMIVRQYCFDPYHPGCRFLRLGSMTYRGSVNVKQVSTGFKHLAFVVEDGRLFAHGSNCLGQCGVSAIKTVKTKGPILVKRKVLSVSCGTAFTVATTKHMTYFCGAYNYHPVTRGYDPCISITDRWLPLCFTIPPTNVFANGGYVNMRWKNFNMSLPVMARAKCEAYGPKPCSSRFTWDGKQYSGVLMGPRPRWRCADVEEPPLCQACGGPLESRVVVVTECCILHMDCAGVCFVKGGRCPCGTSLDGHKSMGTPMC